ncbi:MAG TPA: transcription-repair coupling factor, partial [Acidimicrobiia bacterium]|nr:transcription-repair coupling factor [Acidimicrobiia bacterium]
ELPALLRDDPAFTKLAGGSARVVAVSEAPRAFFLAGLARLTGRCPLVVGVPTTAEAERLVHDLGQFLPEGGGGIELFPAWETLPFERVSPATETMGRRLRVLWRLRCGTEDPSVLPQVIVAPVRALAQRLGPHVEDVVPITVKAGQVVDRDELAARLVAAGYRREYQVEARGEFAVRGSILDVYPSTADHPVRIDLWGDEVDRLQTFSVADQRATGDIGGAVEIFPCRELLPTGAVRARAEKLIAVEPWGRAQWERLSEGLLFDGMESWLPWLTEDERLLPDLLPEDALVLLVEPRQMRDRVGELNDEEASLANSLASTWGLPEGHDMPRLSLPFDRLLQRSGADAWTVLAVPDRPDTPHIAGTPIEGVHGDPSAFAGRVRGLLDGGYRGVFAADGTGSAERIRRALADEGVIAPIAPAADVKPGGRVVVAPLQKGFVVPSLKLAVVAEADLTGRRRVHRKPRGARRGEDFYDDLKVGDYVVHTMHGVGRYAGMVARTMGGVERDYLLVEYKGGDKLYIPSDQVSSIRRYTGGDSPALSRMGGADWSKSKAKVKKAVQEIAQELVVLYRKRMATPGHAFAPDTPWQSEMEAAFPYEATPDQAKAIDDVKADMELPRPMDRLVCGDVGFGKTEVAIRAAFKAVQDGKQVAVLVPTTLLADQHGQTFRERFAGYPVRVETLSRFLTAKEAKAVVRDVESGAVDVIIGTHRLLSEDIKFKDLGLLVVDEEQRFGVSHKEKMKKLRVGVDVLTMSATPIPRTLEMSLTGIRDMSLITTPPEDRQPILTYVGESDDRATTEAIRRELLREGQVFYVHNRVMDIENKAMEVRELVPEARVVVAHGQMDEGTLERVMIDFADRRYDVLVSTTIIESGLDMPSVNTMVVDRADMLGLAQLYQLRGRVGRSGQRAYAYLFHPQDRVLTEEAYERLKTLGEFTDLGSGFKIAMRDLEIRGAGNLLGGEQSGHIAAVGFDLYCQMVTEAVSELTGEAPPEPPPEISIDVPVTASIPRDYIARDDLRMEAYRRLAAVMHQSDVEDVAAEWADRYGPPPPPAAALLAVARLRAEAVRLGMSDISVQKGSARLFPLQLRESQKLRLKRLAPRALVKSNDEIVLPLVAQGPVGSKQDGLKIVEGLLTMLAELVPVGQEAATMASLKA